jgi:UPF0716 protein FxsA
MRPSLWIFLTYVFVELALIILVASWIGLFAVIILLIAGVAFGSVIMGNAGTAASQAMREANQTGQLPPGKVGDSAVLFVGGLLIAIPGFLTDLIGIPLTIPPLRRVTRRWVTAFFERWVRRQGMSVVTTNVDGTTVTRVMPGDVIVGDVVESRDASPGSAPTDPTAGPPPEIEP